MARYGATLKSALAYRGWWKVLLFLGTFAALEQDYLGSKAVVKQLNVKKVDAEGAASGSTSTKLGLQLEDKCLRDCAQNAMVISVMTLREEDHQRAMAVACSVAEPPTEFHSMQNKDWSSNCWTETSKSEMSFHW